MNFLNRPRARVCLAVALLAAMPAGCAHRSAGQLPIDKSMLVNRKKHPNEFYFQGAILHFARLKHEMAFITGQGSGMNEVVGFYTATTKIYINNKKAVLSRLRPGMPAQIRGHRVIGKNGRKKLLYDIIRFSTPGGAKGK